MRVDVESYLASINPLAKKIARDIDDIKHSRGPEWSRLSAVEQEAIIDRCIIHEEVGSDSYNKSVQHAQTSDDDNKCFPKRMVPCGEKIMVDFDNADGWTWRDEHSGPFSWATKSQQDISVLESEDSQNCNKISRTPDIARRKINANLAYKPEKSIWDSPFLAAERGPSLGGEYNLLDSGGDDDIFSRFGITGPAGTVYTETKVESREQGCEEVEQEEEEEEEDEKMKETMPVSGITIEIEQPVEPEIKTVDQDDLLDIDDDDDEDDDTDESVKTQISRDMRVVSCEIVGTEENLETNEESPMLQEDTISDFAYELNLDDDTNKNEKVDDSSPTPSSDSIPKTGFDFLDNW